jgi:hypothetical protein
LESHEPLYVRWQGVSANRSDRDTLAFALECLPAELLRLKGLVRNTPTDDIHVVHAVGRRCEIVTRAPRAGDPQGRLLSAIMRSDGRDGQTLKIILDELFETSSNQ